MTGNHEMEIAGAVEALHADLAAWLGSAASDEIFERFAAAQHERFSMVTLSGAVLGRDELLAGLRGARNAQPGLQIEVSEVMELTRAGELVVIRFLERHGTEEDSSSRRVTAVLCAEDGPSPRYRWLAVHETATDE
ncbi:hypothetical protein [Nocardia lijiangensis]|uniref:hypothetical protein n=1 Tax=Nocardia lijiangensis TaxID=299618 RepID=UPI000A03EAC0|nr:hypothetical protein [Nocardia lijiangensis]